MAAIRGGGVICQAHLGALPLYPAWVCSNERSGELSRIGRILQPKPSAAVDGERPLDLDEKSRDAHGHDGCASRVSGDRVGDRMVDCEVWARRVFEGWVGAPEALRA